MKYFRLTQNGFPTLDSGNYPGFYLRIEFGNSYKEWELMIGQVIRNWNPSTCAYFEKEADHVDFPFTENDIHVYSPKFKHLMQKLIRYEIQFLPLQIVFRPTKMSIGKYYLANYLKVIDCIDRENSKYELWTKENLLFWEKREYLLGSFSYIDHLVLDSKKITDAKIFRPWGWKMAVIVREDLKDEIENAKITGCIFSSLEIS